MPDKQPGGPSGLVEDPIMAGAQVDSDHLKIDPRRRDVFDRSPVLARINQQSSRQTEADAVREQLIHVWMMLIIRGVNVFPREIEAVVLDDPSLGSQYAIVIDRRGTLPELEILVELASDDFAPRRGDIAAKLGRRLLERLRLRVQVVVGDGQFIPRQETGKARRVYERTVEPDPFPQWRTT